MQSNLLFVINSTRDLYQKFCKQEVETLPIFFQPWYLDVVCGDASWQALVTGQDDKPVAIWPLYVKKKGPFSYATMPPLTPYLGPWVSPAHSVKNTTKYLHYKKHSSALLQQLPSIHYSTIHCAPELDYPLCLYWSGAKLISRYTYRLDLNNEESLWEGIESKQKNRIRNAQQKYTSIESDNISVFYSFIVDSFGRQGLSVPYSEGFLQDYYSTLKNHGAVRLTVAIDKNSTPVAGILCVYDASRVYLIATGLSSGHRDSHTISMLIWEALCFFCPTHQIFDFEGSMIPSIEKFFRSFGGTLTPYIRLESFSSLFSEIIFRFKQGL